MLAELILSSNARQSGNSGDKLLVSPFFGVKRLKSKTLTHYSVQLYSTSKFQFKVLSSPT